MAVRGQTEFITVRIDIDLIDEIDEVIELLPYPTPRDPFIRTLLRDRLDEVRKQLKPPRKKAKPRR